MRPAPATTVFDSMLFRDAFGTPRVREVFSDYALVGRYAEVEIALAKAEAKVTPGGPFGSWLRAVRSRKVEDLNADLQSAAATKAGDSWKEGVPWYDVTQAFIPFIVGVVLFVNGRRWAVTLARRDTASASPTAPVSEKHEADT